MISDERRPATADQRPVDAGDRPATDAEATPEAAAATVQTAAPDGASTSTSSAIDGEALPGPTEPGPPDPVKTERRRGRIRRFLTHEWTVAALGAILLAVVLTWPTLADPLHTIPQDVGDPTLQAWQMAWTGHALLTDPWNLWHANTFYPEYYTLAFSDSLLGYAPAGMIGEGFEAAILRYNIMFVLVHALAFFGAYALVRQLGAGRAAGVIAGIAFAFAPWRLAHGGHLNVLSTGAIALALAMLARGHGWSLRYGYRPELRKPGWALAGWLVAGWQVTLGFGLGVPFGYFLGGASLVAILCYLLSWLFRRRRPPFGGRLLAADLVGGFAFLGIVGAMAVPYLAAVERYPYARRSLAEVTQFSPPLEGFLTSPQESWLWGELHIVKREALSWAAEMALLPGFVLITLAVLGLFFSVFRWYHRIFLAIGIAVTTFLGLGTSSWWDGEPGYVTLYNTLPGWDALRTPGRLVLWITIMLCILAAGAVSAIERYAQGATLRAEQTGDRRHSWRADLLWLAALLPLPLVLAESVNQTGHPVVDAQPAVMREVKGPLLVLPSEGIMEDVVMLWTVDGFPRIVNGVSGVTPHSTDEIRLISATFPDAHSVNYLRSIGIREVVVLTDRVIGTRWDGLLQRPTAGLGIRVEERDTTRVYHLGG